MSLQRVGIIPDGNRRYSLRRGISTERAYVKGFENVGHAAKWAREAKLTDLTFWALSLDNFAKRSREELAVVFKLLDAYATKALKQRDDKAEGIRTRFFGKLNLLPTSLRRKLRDVEHRTRRGDEMTVHVALAYNGKEELLQAVKKLARQARGRRVDDVTEAEFEKLLYHPQAPDLVIRTGNVQRLSGFLPWQTAYSELYFSPKLWPEFNKTDFQHALDFYEQTQRNFGR